MAQQQPIPIPNYMKFIFGGTAGMMATCVVQPLDLVKTRMQTSSVGTATKEYKTSLHLIKDIVKKEGVFAMYTGLSAALLRQATYTTTRLGVYQYLFDICSADGKTPNFAMKAVLGMASGGIASFVGTPAEVALIRMTADGRLPLAERRNYKNVVDALYRIVTEEGLFTLWRGAIPTMGRAMVVNAAQLATYSQAKQMLLASGHFEDNIACHFWASMVSGFVTTAASLPVDIAKTRIQNMKITEGKPEYKGTIDVISKVIRREGLFALWKGFTPYFARLGPHTVLTFIFLEQLNAGYRKHFATNE